LAWPRSLQTLRGYSSIRMNPEGPSPPGPID
jgi:hypothetical protein